MPEPDHTPASPPQRITTLEAEVYREVVLRLHETANYKDEPTTDEVADGAARWALMLRLQRAADTGRTVLDPVILPALEGWEVEADVRRTEAEEARLDESEQALAIEERRAACVRMIARLKAYNPPLCEVCHATATHRDPHGEPSCERCARYAVAHDLGESYAAGELIEAFAEAMYGLTVSPADLTAASAALADGEGAHVGMLARHFEAIEQERADGKDGLLEADRWETVYTPIEGGQ